MGPLHRDSIAGGSDIPTLMHVDSLTDEYRWHGQAKDFAVQRPVSPPVLRPGARRSHMTPHGKASFPEGIVSLQRYGMTFTGQWIVTDSRLTVYLGLDKESTLLGMFEKEPETLAIILLSDLVKRQLEKSLLPQ
jgi:hypothetical protein